MLLPYISSQVSLRKAHTESQRPRRLSPAPCSSLPYRNALSMPLPLLEVSTPPHVQTHFQSNSLLNKRCIGFTYLFPIFLCLFDINVSIEYNNPFICHISYSFASFSFYDMNGSFLSFIIFEIHSIIGT